MKKFLNIKLSIFTCKLLVITISFVFCNNLIAQSKINGIAHYSNNVLCLRWAVEDYETYELIKKHGFTLQRQTLVNGTDTLSLPLQTQSNVIISLNEKPKSLQWIKDNLPSSSFVGMLANGLYSTDPDTSINFDNPKLIDAVNKSKQDKARLFGIQYAAEQNFNIALAASLGDIDQSALPNMKYKYIVSIKDSLGQDLIEPFTIIKATYQSETFAPVLKPKAIGVPGGIELAWPKTEQTSYVGYDIYRSKNSIDFNKVNSEPFVFFKTKEIESNDVIFIDSVPAGELYTYRVVGITPFGFDTAPSDTASAVALFSKLKGFEITIEKPNPTMTEVPLIWTSNASFNADLQGFNIYRSDNYDGTYTKLNSNYINASNRSFTDQSPIAVGYYYIEALDIHGYKYFSNPEMVYLPDSIPPAIPSGLIAKYFGVSKVQLDWTHNTESDLAGYRLEMSNHFQGPFTQITETYTTSNQLNYYTDPKVAGDSIFFRIFSQDKRGNYSDKSTPVGIKRPDIVPPAAPGFSKAMPHRNGIHLKWDYSPTSSVVKHVVERRPVGTPSWSQVVTITNAQKSNFMPTATNDFNFRDSSSLEQRQYEYRVVAFEPHDIKASSKPILVTPLPVVVTNTTIQNFAIDLEVETGAPNRKVQEQIENLRRAEGSTRFSAAQNKKHHMKLSWVYKLDPNLQDFQIYRSISGANMSLYKTISLAEAMGLDPDTEVTVNEDLGPNPFTCLDKDLMTGRRYTYQVMARHKDLSGSNRSIALSKKVEEN